MSALEQSMRDICAKHGLASITVTCHNDSHLSLNVQWYDPSQEYGRGCAMGDGETFSECLTDALHKMAEQRPAELADVALEVAA